MDLYTGIATYLPTAFVAFIVIGNYFLFNLLCANSKLNINSKHQDEHSDIHLNSA